MSVDPTRGGKPVKWLDLPNIAAPDQYNLIHKSFNQAFGMSDQLRMSVGPSQAWDSVDHHRHFTMDEICYLMKSKSMLRVGDEEYEVEENTAIFFPPEPMRSVCNHTDEDCW